MDEATHTSLAAAATKSAHSGVRRLSRSPPAERLPVGTRTQRRQPPRFPRETTSGPTTTDCRYLETSSQRPSRHPGCRTATAVECLNSVQKASAADGWPSGLTSMDGEMAKKGKKRGEEEKGIAVDSTLPPSSSSTASLLPTSSSSLPPPLHPQQTAPFSRTTKRATILEQRRHEMEVEEQPVQINAVGICEVANGQSTQWRGGGIAPPPTPGGNIHVMLPPPGSNRHLTPTVCKPLGV